MRRIILFSVLLSALTCYASVTTSSGCIITYNTSSSLTGETGVTCIECPSASAFYAGWVEAGKPQKVKIIGPFAGLSSIFDGSEESGIITYLDLSEAVMEETSLNEHQLAYMASQEDDDVCKISTLVLPDCLTSFYFLGLRTYWGDSFFPLKDIYTNNPSPFKIVTGYTDISSLLHVPNGSKAAWQEYISSTSNMIVCDTPVKTVTTTKGYLSNKLTSRDIQNVDVLVVNGEINAKDFVILSQMKELTRLDLNASIKSYSGSGGPVSSYTVYKDNEIPSFAFANHPSLRLLYLPRNYQLSIGDYAFDGCLSFEHFGYNPIDDNGFSSSGRYYDTYGVSGKLGDFAFRSTKTGRVWLMGSLEEIGKNPFFGTSQTIIERYPHYVINGDDETVHYELANFSTLEEWEYSEDSQHPYQLLLSKDQSILYASHWGYKKKNWQTREYETITKELNLPASLKEVKDYALSDILVKNITLNSSLEVLGEAFLYKCKELESITATGNYVSEDGVLFTADMKTLIKYPCAKTADKYFIPASVEEIGKWAFEGTKNLRYLFVKSPTPPSIEDLVFEDVDLSQIILYVPKGSKAIYEATDIWKDFRMIIEVDGSLTDLPKCATPVIQINDATLNFSCETEGVTYKARYTYDSGSTDIEDDKMVLAGSIVCHVTVYAVREGYQDSDAATIDIKVDWGKQGDTNKDGKVTITDAVSVVNIILNNGEATAPVMESPAVEAPEVGEPE